MDEGRDTAGPRARHALRWGLLLVAAIVLLLLGGREAGALVPRAVAWVEDLGAWGPVAYVFGYALAVPAFVPGSILTLAGGALFGLGWGTLYSFLGATLGSALAFGLARTVARGPLERRLSGDPRFEAIDRAVASRGLRIVFLLRLSPLFPFTLLNYALGLTRVRFVHYLIASIGMLPGTLLYVYYGKAAGDVAAAASGALPKGTAHHVLLAVGLVATIIVGLVVARIARRALAGQLEP